MKEERDMEFYENMEKSLMEAIEMEKGNIPLIERKDMPVPTFVSFDKEKGSIEDVI